jgi:ferredoxin
MAYVITEPCIDVKHKTCVDVCPVSCIYIESDELDRMLYIKRVH